MPVPTATGVTWATVTTAATRRRQVSQTRVRNLPLHARAAMAITAEVPHAGRTRATCMPVPTRTGATWATVTTAATRRRQDSRTHVQHLPLHARAAMGTTAEAHLWARTRPTCIAARTATTPISEPAVLAVLSPVPERMTTARQWRVRAETVCTAVQPAEARTPTTCTTVRTARGRTKATARTAARRPLLGSTITATRVENPWVQSWLVHQTCLSGWCSPVAREVFVLAVALVGRAFVSQHYRTKS